MMEQPCAWRGMWDTARVSCDLGWRGDRSNGPSSVLAVWFLSHSSLRPEEFCKDQVGFFLLLPPPAPDTLTSPQLGFCQKLFKNKKPNKNKQKETQEDLQSLLAVVTVNPEAKMCQKVGQGLCGVPGSAASSPADSGKEPNIHKQVSCLKLIYLLKQHSAKPVINIFLPRLLT